MTSVRTRELVDRLDRASAACPDVDALARAVFDAVAVDIPFAFGCLATTDPATELITSAIKSRPLEIGDEDFSAAEYGRPDVNRFVELARRPTPVGALWLDTDGHPETCHRLREYMRPVFGFTDELRLACLSRRAMWGALALYRGEGEPPFTEREATLLAGVHPLIAERIQQILFAGPATPTADGRGAAVLIVDAQDGVTDVTAAVEAHIADLGGWDHGSLPANVLAVAALARTTAAPAATRVKGRSGSWLSLRAMPLDGPSSRRSVVVTVDAAPPAVVGELTLAARGLTARETDVVQLVLQGASTKDIAASLHLSPHTVQDHLKAVFAKLDVTSRRELIARLTA